MPTYARRYQLQGSLVYHVYNRSHRGEYIFRQPEDFEHFRNLLLHYKSEFNIKFYHWVIMSNHYHFSVWLEEPEKLPRIIAGLQRAYTHYFNRRQEVKGYLWQGRYKSQPLEREKYLVACGRYIERNPVRARIVNRAQEYRYSSARYYCLGEEDGITSEDPFFTGIGQDIESRRTIYAGFLTQFDNEEEKQFRDLARPLGGKVFIGGLIKDGYSFLSRRQGRPRKIS